MQSTIRDEGKALVYVTKVTVDGSVALHLCAARIIDRDTLTADSPLPAHASVEHIDAATFSDELLHAATVSVWVDGTLVRTLTSSLDDLWTAKQCADHLGVAPRTWLSYVHRPALRNPAPQPATTVGATPLWRPTEVTTYGEARRVRKRPTATVPQNSDHPPQDKRKS